MQHDVIVDRYARLYEQPRQLARNGHSVLGLCLSYHSDPDVKAQHSVENGELYWQSWKLGLWFVKFPICVFRILREIYKFKPNYIVAGSDQIHIILGAASSFFFKCRLAVDLYDNFESYGIGLLPGLNFFYRQSLKRAQLITCVSPTLKKYISTTLNNKTRVEVLFSTIGFDSFLPLSKKKCREKFNLNQSQIFIGTAGNLRKKMGIEILYEAIKSMSVSHPHIRFVLAGPHDSDCAPPSTKNVVYLGKINHKLVCEFLNALDVAVIYQSDNQYGRYAFPQKALEITACKVPMVIADVGCMKEIFTDIEECFYQHDDPDSLVKCLLFQVEKRKVSDFVIQDWAEHGSMLSQWLVDCEFSGEPL